MLANSPNPSGTGHATIDWCCLIREHRRFVQASLEELAERLVSRYKQSPRIKLIELTACDTSSVSAFVEHHLSDASHKPDIPKSLAGKLPFIFCSENEPFVHWLQEAEGNNVAESGAAQIGKFAFAWKLNNKYLIWHEAMHLLYAADCYDPADPYRPYPDCDEQLRRCLMQYDPSERNCGGDLFLCRSNLGRINANLGC